MTSLSSQVIDFYSLGLRGFHLWLSGGDLFEVDHIVRDTIPQLPQIEVVFINLSYFSYEYDNATIKNRWERRKWLYSVTDRWQYIHGDRNKFLIGKLNKWTKVDSLWSNKTEHKVRAILGHDHPARQSFRDLDGRRQYVPYIECQHLWSYEQLVQESSVPVERHIRLTEEMQLKNTNIKAKTLAVLSGLLAYLADQGINVVLYTSPYFIEYSNLYAQSDVAEMKRITYQVAQAHQVPYLDYSSHPDFVHEYKLYYNADHMNLCGARKFSQVLATTLQLRRSKTQ